MNLIIFGATGSVGQHLTEQALTLDYNVTAFSRNPDTLEIRHRNLKKFRGDVLDATTVKKAIQGHDAVICALGAGSKGTVRSKGTLHIIKAMQDLNIRRLICLSTIGVGDSWDNLNFFWKYIMFSLLLRKAFKDHVQQEKTIKMSNLDWTIVRPGAFTDGPKTETYKHGFSSSHSSAGLKISRADVAHFMLRQLTDETYLHKTPGISY